MFPWPWYSLFGTLVPATKNYSAPLSCKGNNPSYLITTIQSQIILTVHTAVHLHSGWLIWREQQDVETQTVGTSCHVTPAAQRQVDWDERWGHAHVCLMPPTLPYVSSGRFSPWSFCQVFSCSLMFAILSLFIHVLCILPLNFSSLLL